MAEIDNLSIQISASADSAEKSIDKLIGSLRRLNQNLALGNVSTFARQMREITNSAKGLSEASSAISSIAKAGRDLGNLSGYKTVNDQMRETESESKKLAKSIADTFNFKENGTAAAKQNIKDLTMMIEVMFDKLEKGKSIQSDADLFSAVLPNMQGFKNVLDEDYQAIKKFADQYKVFVNETQKGDLEHLYGSLAKASKELGVNLTDKLDVAKFKDLEEYFTRIKELTNIDFMQGKNEPLAGLERMKDYLADYAKSAEQAAKASMGDESFYKEQGEKLAQTVKGIYDRIHDESKVKNPFEGITEGVKALQGVKIPQLDGLTQLASDLERISKVNAKTIADIAKALNKFGSMKDSPAAEMADTVQKIAQSRKKATEEAVKEEVKVPIDVKDVEEQAEKVKGILGGLYEERAKLKDSISKFQIGKANLTDDEYTSMKDRLSEINNSLSNLDGDKASKAVEKVGQSAEEATKKLSRLEQVIHDTFAQGFKQDGASAGLAGILEDIKSYSQQISDMKAAPQIFDKSMFEEFSQKLQWSKKLWEEFERSTHRKIRLGGALDEASKEATTLRDRLEDLKRLQSEMDSGKVGYDMPKYREWSEEIEKISERLDELKGKKKEVEQSGGNLNFLANLIALGHEIGNIADAFDRVANLGIRGLQLAFKPLSNTIEEYKKKIAGLADSFKKLHDIGRKNLDKLSQFWKRSMKTFTFMLVRKAITAIITEMSDAIKSLALWSKQFGTIFNDSMSQITSNFSYIARSIVGAFEPLINYIVPAFNALSDAIAHAAARLGEFFAALTGQGYYMAAKRQVTDYAESVDKANKAQKNLISGLDDLNVITTPTSTSNGIDDLAAQWEKVDVSDTMKDWAQTVKDFAKRLFAPIKKAWDNTKDHVINGWKYMTSELGKMFKDIGRDFMKVWEQPQTQKIFENIFDTVGNIEEAVGHLARNFRKAWNENDVGLHILENIRDIILNISEHVLNMSDAFKKWADDLDFSPLLKAVEDFTKRVQPLIDFLGNLMEEVWQRVILAHWKFLVEKGIPHLLEAISNVIDAFNFDKILEDIKPVLDAFERMRENIDIGIVNAFENLGKAVAEFANSEDFSHFMENVAWFMDQITAERVEKLFTALGQAIWDVAEALMKFVGSEKFKDFMTRLFEWYDKLSVDDIAGFIQKIAIAIAAFKFTAFVGKGLAGFFQFLSVVQSFKGIGGIISGMAGALGGLSGVALPVAGILAAVAVAGYSLIKSFGGLDGVLNEVQKHFKIVKDAVKEAWEKFNMSETIDRLKESFKNLTGALGDQKSLWQVLFGLLDAVFVLIADVAIPMIQVFIDALSASMEVIGGVIDAVGGLFDLLKGFFTGDSDLVLEGWNRLCEGIGQAFQGVYDLLAAPGALVSKFVEGIVDFFKWMKHVLIGDPIVLDTTDGIIKAFADMVKEVIEGIGKFVEDAVNWFINLKDRAIELFNELKDKAIQKFLEMKNKVIEKVTEMKNRVISKVTELKNEAIHKFNELKEQAIQKFNELKDNAIARFEELKNNVVQRITNLKNDAVSLFDQLKNDVVGIAGRIAEDVSHKFWDMVDWASDAFWGVVNAAGSILGQVPGAISSALSGVGGAISGALSGIGSSVSSAFGSVVDAARDIGRQVINGFDQGANQQSNQSKWFNNTDTWGKVTTNARRVFGISSPSKVFREVGGYLVEGLDEGIEDNINDSKKSLEKLYKGMMSVDLPKFDLDAAVPKSSLKMDSYQHTDFTGTATFDQDAMQSSMRSAIQESIGSLILPYLNDIANSSRETANKNLTISSKDVHTAVRVEDKRFKTQTGRSAFAY